MFEFDNNKTGKVKVLNVTEARANFSDLLSDLSAHYVITKNNKPLRVVISYSEYQQISKWIKENDIELEVDSSIKDAPKTRKKPQKTRVKGLLESHMQMQEKKASQPKPKPKKSSSPSVDDEKRKLIEKLLGSSAQTDYFADEEDDVVEEFQTAPPTPAETYQKAKNEVQEEKSTAEFSEEDFWNDDSDNAEEPQEPLSQEPEPEVAETDPELDDMTPEQREYYEKYKKLYQSLGQPIEEKPSATQEVPDVDLSNEFSMNFSKDEPEEFEIEESDPFEEELKSRLEKTEPKTRPSQRKQEASGNDLPSLKDLLQELEDEKLSSDEGEENSKDLNEGDIDDLIHRITHDY